MATNKKSANRHKLRVFENTKIILREYSVCQIFAPSTEKLLLAHFRKNQMIEPSLTLLWHLTNIRVKWEIIVGVLCRNQEGKNYIRYHVLQVGKECLIKNIHQQVDNACKILFNQAPKLHRLCPFWYAQPQQEAKIEDQIKRIVQTIHYYKAFNRIATQFELNANKPFVDQHTEKWLELLVNMDFVEVDLDAATLNEEVQFAHLYHLTE